MLTPKRPALRIRHHVSDVRAGLNETSGGSSETDASELTTGPCGRPPGAAVTIATPVAKRPSAWRNARGSGGDAALAGAIEVELNGAPRLHRARHDPGSRTPGSRRADA